MSVDTILEYFPNHISWPAAKFNFGIGSSPILRNLSNSLRKRVVDQALLTAISGWLSYLIASPKSITTIFIPFLTMLPAASSHKDSLNCRYGRYPLNGLGVLYSTQKL